LRRRIEPFTLVGLLALAHGCFSQEATLGLECTSARACGRDQACIDGVCQRTGDEPVYCPLRDDVIDLGNTFPVATDVLVPTNALDLLGECSGGDAQAVYLWSPPQSGDFLAHVQVLPAYFAFDDSRPSIILRSGGCIGRQDACDLDRPGAHSFAATRNDVLVLTLDDVPPIDAGEVGFRLLIEGAEQCIGGGSLASTVPLQIQGTTRGSQDAVQPDRCSGSVGQGYGPEVAFSWAAPRTGTFAFHAASDDGSVLVYLFDTDCGGTQLACANDLGSSGVASTAVSLQANQRVVVVVDSPEQTSDIDFELTIDEAFGCVPVEHDLGFQFPTAGLEVDAAEATTTSAITCAPTDAPQLVYRWTAPASAFWTFDTQTSDVPVLLSVLEGSCIGSVLQCDTGTNRSNTAEDGQIILPVATGQDLVLAAAPQSAGVVRITLTQTPCGSKLLASPLPIVESGRSAARAAGPLECNGLRPQPEDATFSWRAPAQGTYEFTVEAAGAEPLLYLLESSCAGRTLACSHEPAPQIRLDLGSQDTVVLGIAVPVGTAEVEYTLRIDAG